MCKQDGKIENGALSFCQKFHEGNHVTEWQAQLSVDGSKLEAGQWKDGVHGEAGLHGDFSAKRVASAAASAVEIVIVVEEQHCGRTPVWGVRRTLPLLLIIRSILSAI